MMAAAGRVSLKAAVEVPPELGRSEASDVPYSHCLVEEEPDPLSGEVSERGYS